MNTGISRKTNLARCFDCEKSYNTIDLVKEIMGSRFLESVAYLEKIKEQMSAETNRKYPSEKMNRQNELVHIGDVFKSLVSPSPEKASSTRALRQESSKAKLRGLDLKFGGGIAACFCEPTCQFISAKLCQFISAL